MKWKGFVADYMETAVEKTHLNKIKTEGAVNNKTSTGKRYKQRNL